MKLSADKSTMMLDKSEMLAKFQLKEDFRHAITKFGKDNPEMPFEHRVEFTLQAQVEMLTSVILATLHTGEVPYEQAFDAALGLAATVQKALLQQLGDATSTRQAYNVSA